jgi:hypothetical protein
MKAIILMRVCACSTAGAILFCAIGTMLAEPRAHLKLNEDAVAFAVHLVKQGHCVADNKGAWSQHRPSTEEENEFIRVYGFSEYAKWYLGIDERYSENTKRRYKFPYGDFKNVHRCALLAVKARAHQYGHTEIENAADQLLEIIASRQGR